MKHYLLPKNGQFYKANLHTHSTCSDGRLSPEEVKQLYKGRGYSVLALTDHDIMLSHTDLNDESFLTITSFEMALNCKKPHPSVSMPVYHLNFYAPCSEPKENPFFCEARVTHKNAKELVTDEMRNVNYMLDYSQQDVNRAIALAKKEGYLVCYNHPVWSLQNFEDYRGLRGLWGVEVFNTGCVLEGYPDTVQPFVDLNRLGERVAPIAADDLHGSWDAFGGFVMIKAEKLNYESVFSALKNYDFYASSGPEISELWLEDGMLHISCSPAVQITVNTERRVVPVLWAKDAPITTADIDLRTYLEKSTHVPKEEWRPYFRVTVMDEHGKHAWTRCYYLDELGNDMEN